MILNEQVVPSLVPGRSPFQDSALAPPRGWGGLSEAFEASMDSAERGPFTSGGTSANPKKHQEQLCPVPWPHWGCSLGATEEERGCCAQHSTCRAAVEMNH